MKPYETYSDSESNETITQHDGSIRHPSMEEQEIKERKWPSSIVNMNMLQDTAMDPDGKRPLMEIHAYSESESDGTTDTKVVEHDGILEIQDRMWEYLQFLSTTSHTETDQFNSRVDVNFPNVHNKILAAFGQCKDIPIFLFDMTLHSVSDWLALYACAIRCAIQKQGGARHPVVFRHIHEVTGVLRSIWCRTAGHDGVYGSQSHLGGETR